MKAFPLKKKGENPCKYPKMKSGEEIWGNLKSCAFLLNRGKMDADRRGFLKLITLDKENKDHRMVT